YPSPALTVRHRREDVEASLEPGCEALRDLDCFVQLVFGGEHTLFGRLRSLENEVAVQFHHGSFRRNRLRAINLDFVVVLGTANRAAPSERKKENDRRQRR